VLEFRPKADHFAGAEDSDFSGFIDNPAAFSDLSFQDEALAASEQSDEGRNKARWSLTQEAFDRLLQWLDQDRDEAGLKYESIRSKLIRIFKRYGWTTAEDLADESINRVTQKN